MVNWGNERTTELFRRGLYRPQTVDNNKHFVFKSRSVLRTRDRLNFLKHLKNSLFQQEHWNFLGVTSKT